VQWVWLLHDDCEPAPDALERMLAVAGRSPSAAVLGPKLRDLSDRQVLREAGITTDRAGRRVTRVEPGEIDQGQHDGNRAVMAVSSAGMLVRRDVWDTLGGFDASLPLFRDDIDFCWRAHAAGYEVRVVTDAVVYHRDMSARQIRGAPAAGGHLHLLDRRSALYVLAVNLPLLPMLAVVGGCVAGSLLRAVCYLLTKQQRKAAAHLGAVAWLLRHPVLLGRARRRRAAGRQHGYTIVRGQLPRGRTLARLAESAVGLLSRGSGYETGGLHQAVTDEPGDDMPPPAADSLVRRVLTSPGVLLFVALAVIALVAERSLTGPVLTGSGTLGGGALVPPWGGAGALWREYLAGYHDAGIGSTASAPPYLGMVAVLATLLGGKLWLAVDVVLFGCVPAAGITAFLATRRLTPVLPARIWIAATYALLPVAMGAVAAGRIGTAIAFVLLPLIGIMIARVVSAPPRGARRAAWAAGLLIAIAAAFVPLIWPVAVAAALGAAAGWRWLGRRTVVNAAIVAIVPAAVLVPWTYHLLSDSSAFLTEAGLLRPGLAGPGLRAESLLLLSPGGPGLPPAWVTAGLLLPAFCALLARRRTALVNAGWGIALPALAIALAISRVRVTPPQGGAAVTAWPGFPLALAAAGLLLAAAPLIETADRGLRRTGPAAAGRRPWPGWRTLATAAGLAVAASAPALAAGYWLARGVAGPLAPAGPQVLPAFVAAASAGPDRARTLVLRRDRGALVYTVLRNADPLLGEPELTETASSARALERAVASLDAAGSGLAGDAGEVLSQFGIGYVLLPAPVDQLLAQQLDAAAGMQQLTRAPGYELWRVSAPVARASVITPVGAVMPVPSGPIGVQAVLAPATSGTLVLAETAGGWSASLDGKPLLPVAQPVDGWAQGFELPRGGGRLVVTRNETAREISLGCQAAALLVAFALALPGARSPAPGPAQADSGAVPAPGGRPERARGAGPTAPARRRRRPQLALAGARARADVPDGADAGYGPPGAASVPASGYDPAADPGFGAAPDFAPEPGHRAAPDFAPEPGHRAAPDFAPDSRHRAAVAAGRGGQHAARHGKPARRWRRDTAAGQPDPSPPGDAP
jgi:hypothetical protein